MKQAVLFMGVAMLVLASACAGKSVIPEELKEQTAGLISIQEVRSDPEEYGGQSVLWGGRIVQTRQTQEGTLMEVVKFPLDSNDRPKEVDQSEGRFLVLHSDFLDSAIYSQGREVTVVGTIQGTRTQQLDQIRYEYPLLDSREVHLWEKREERREHIYPYGPGSLYRPYWGWGYPWWW